MLPRDDFPQDKKQCCYKRKGVEYVKECSFVLHCKFMPRSTADNRGVASERRGRMIPVFIGGC